MKVGKVVPGFYPGTKTKPGSQFSLIHFSVETRYSPRLFLKNSHFFCDLFKVALITITLPTIRSLCAFKKNFPSGVATL